MGVRHGILFCMAIIVFQHHESCRPGRLGLTLRDTGFKLDVRRLDRGDRVPADLDNVEGVVSLGGPASVADLAERPDWMLLEMEFLKRAHEAQLPVIGLCLGHQLVAAALGGDVGRMSTPERGFCEVEITPAGQTEAMLAGIVWRSQQFCHHQDEVKKLPEGAVGLVTSERCAVQAFRVGLRTYGFQYHFEADRIMAHEIMKVSGGKASDTEVTFGQQVEKHYSNFARLADRLCLNLATYLFTPAQTV